MQNYQHSSSSTCATAACRINHAKGSLKKLHKAHVRSQESSSRSPGHANACAHLLQRLTLFHCTWVKPGHKASRNSHPRAALCPATVEQRWAHAAQSMLHATPVSPSWYAQMLAVCATGNDVTYVTSCIAALGWGGWWWCTAWPSSLQPWLVVVRLAIVASVEAACVVDVLRQLVVEPGTGDEEACRSRSLRVDARE